MKYGRTILQVGWMWSDFCGLQHRKDFGIGKTQCNARETWKTDAYFLYHLLEELSSAEILGFDF